jgi:hypothetical protein
VKRPTLGAIEKLKTVKLSSFEGRVAPDLDRVRDEVQRAADAGAPVLVGPFTSEVGFELLYWIPMLRWAVREFPALRGRLIVISRGGTQEWLQGLDASYVDVFSLMTPEELVRRRESLKQREVTSFELEIYAEVRERLGVPDAVTLHPGVLFNLYYRVLKLQRHGFAQSVRRTEQGEITGLLADFAPLTPPDDLGPLGDLLPEEYVAVRFYARPSLPANEENTRFVRAVVSGLARDRPVVLLNNGLELDDHSDLELTDNANVIDLRSLMTPENNLGVQTIALSRAQAFIGTYGGLAYLAPHFGVPVLAFSSQPEHTHPWHTDLAQRVFSGPPWGNLVVLRPSDLELIDLVLRGMR